jgi:uncharacterized protein YjbI with pentapeptide repeats
VFLFVWLEWFTLHCGFFCFTQRRTGANLHQAWLSLANLQQANLSKANLLQANLFEANLSGAKLTAAMMPDGEIHL